MHSIKSNGVSELAKQSIKEFVQQVLDDGIFIPYLMKHKICFIRCYISNTKHLLRQHVINE